MSLFAVGGILSASTLFFGCPFTFSRSGFSASSFLCGLRFQPIHHGWLSPHFAFCRLHRRHYGFHGNVRREAYKNGLHRPNAFIDRSRSVLQPTRPDAEMGGERASIHESWDVGLR